MILSNLRTTGAAHASSVVRIVRRDATEMGKLKAMAARVAGMPAKVRAAPKIAEPFYQSRAWRSLVADIKRARGNWCERCGSTHRVIADHIVELKDGGAPLDPSNVELLCQSHHNAKTAKARAARVSGPIR